MKNRITMDLITVMFDSGESVTMNQMEVMWFGKDGGLMGHSSLDEVRDFLREVLQDAKFDAASEENPEENP